MIRRLLVTILILIAPLAGCTGDSNDLQKIPDYTLLTEGDPISSESYENKAYVIVFSAQWCGTPCHNNMHNLNLTSARMAEQGFCCDFIEVLVISTDDDEEPNGVTLSMWKESVDQYDDDKELNQTLEYTFSRVDPTNNFASSMGINAPGTVIFVDYLGYETHRQIGSFGAYNDQATLDIIESHWLDASQIILD